MAELLLRPLVSMVMNKSCSYLLNQYKVMEGMDEQKKILARELPAILDIINDAEEQATHKTGVKTWLEELNKVAYAAKEAFDEFNYEALRRQAKANGHYIKLDIHEKKIFPTHNRLVFRYTMGKKLHSIVHDIEVLMGQMHKYGFKVQKQDFSFKEWRQTDSLIVDPDNIVSRSRDKEKKKIVKILVNATADLTVLPIIGMGGLGKTTLAQLVFNDPQVHNHFQYHRWVCVSNYFDFYDLAYKICPIEGDYEKVLQNLKKTLIGKRYLIILDDVWNRDDDKWDKLKACLQHGATGSVILVTTRIKETAELMGTIEKHDITFLDKKYIREIIRKKAFRWHKSNPELLNMVDKFIERCSGSPLAAKALGSVLADKESQEEWEVVLKKSIICTEESKILSILKLSYDDLPSDMKHCFAFCAMFSKDYVIDVEKLIQLWIANGFIHAKDDHRESIGKKIFNELTSRSFFQDVNYVLDKTTENIRGYSRTTYTIHDLMHDVAQSIKGKECIAQTEKRSEIEWLPDTTHHLFLSCRKPDNLLNASLKKGSPAIQTLLCDIRMDGPLQHLSKYNSMKALQLYQYESSFLLKLKHLSHLRYLDLSSNYIKVLPKDITILYNPQTLNVSHCEKLLRLPTQMKHMTALRHLYTHGCESLMGMPLDLGEVTSLRTLTCFVAGSCSDCCNIREIQNLDLCGQLEIKKLETVAEVADAKLTMLRNKKELRELTLRWTSGRVDDKKQHVVEVLEALTPNDELEVLCIYFYGGNTFPRWIGMLPKIVEIFLVDCDICENLPLCILPALQVLYLEGLSQLRWLCGRDAFFNLPKLKELTLKMLPNLVRWWEIDECQGILFGHLKKLDIIGCEKLTALPGQQTFPNLESVCIKYSSEFIILPEAPKLNVLDVQDGNQRMSLCAARCMSSLTNLSLYLTSGETYLSVVPNPIELVDCKKKWNHKSPMVGMTLTNCNLFFSSSALLLWTCFVQLQTLCISDCDGLIHWPDEFKSLKSLVTLEIMNCKNLTGYTQEASTLEMSQLLPNLKSLEIVMCEELVEVFNLPASIKKLKINYCPKVFLLAPLVCKHPGRSAINEGSFRETTAAAEDSSTSASVFLLPFLEDLRLWECHNLSAVLNVPPSLKHISIIDCRSLESIASPFDELQTADLTELSSSPPREHLPSQPCLERVHIYKCDSLTELLSMPPSVKSISINSCSVLKSLESCSAGLPLLEKLDINYCDTLASLPDDPQAYSSLQTLSIGRCPLLMTLPICLQQRLSSLYWKRLDGHLQEPEPQAETDPPKTWKYSLNKCLGKH